MRLKGDPVQMDSPSGSTDEATWVAETIARFCGLAQNSLGMADGEPVFATPLVGFAAGDDPVFEEFKRHVGAFHLTPGEAFALERFTVTRYREGEPPRDDEVDDRPS